MTQRDNLVACYLSGQIPESAWTEHVREDPVLEALVAAHRQRVGPKTEPGAKNDAALLIWLTGAIFGALAMWGVRALL